jgi:hypothetical protein
MVFKTFLPKIGGKSVGASFKTNLNYAKISS